MTSLSFHSFPLNSSSDDQVFSTDYGPGGGHFGGEVPVNGLVSDSHVEIYGCKDHESRSSYGSVNVENGNGGDGGGLFNDDGVFVTDGPILRRSLAKGSHSASGDGEGQNAILLEEKEARGEELRIQILLDGDDFLKISMRRELNVETNRKTNREREKLFPSNQEKFHKEANQQYWKSIGELIPNEVLNIEKRRGKKEQEKKPLITVVQGPKPGKPTDLSRIVSVLSESWPRLNSQERLHVL